MASGCSGQLCFDFESHKCYGCFAAAVDISKETTADHTLASLAISYIENSMLAHIASVS